MMDNPGESIILRVRPLQAAKNAAASVMASAATTDARLSICHQCEHLLRPTQQCALCGCFMQVKARIQGSKCPRGDW